MESGRCAVLVEMNGASAAFDARGRRLAWTPPDGHEIFVVDVPLYEEITPTSGAVLLVGRRLLHRRRDTPA